MYNLEFFDSFSEIAILFSEKYKCFSKDVYDKLVDLYPSKQILLVPSKSILCSAKSDKYESYFLIGEECPLHSFSNAIQYKIPLEPEIEHKIAQSDGAVFVDSIYSHDSRGYTGEITDETPVMVVTKNQMILDYYAFKYESVESAFGDLEKKSKVQFLMRENAKAMALKNKKMVGVIFTSPSFEELATSIVQSINLFSSAYKIFLKDISYERLISIDNLDSIVLIDCPLFQHNFSLHIPFLSPFSAESAIEDILIDKAEEEMHSNSKELVIRGNSFEIMESRSFKGAVFCNDEEDMKIYQGKKGIASEYEDEGTV